MDFINSSDPLSALNNLLIFLDDSSDNDEGNYYRVFQMLTNETNNKYTRASRRNRRAADVGVQAVSVTEQNSNPWLQEAERKIDQFCVELSKLEDTLHYARNRVCKSKNKAFPSASPKKGQTGKSYLPEFHSQGSGFAKIPISRSETVEDKLMCELIEDGLDSVLQRAMELRNSIPKVDWEKLNHIHQREYEVVESTTVKETNIVRLERSKSSMAASLPPQVYNMKRERTLPTIRESKFKHANQMPRGTVEFNACSVPKTKNVKKTANSEPGTSRQQSVIRGRDLQFENIPTRDTGAIPKNMEARRVTTTTLRTLKTKKAGAKPLWR